MERRDSGIPGTLFYVCRWEWNNDQLMYQPVCRQSRKHTQPASFPILKLPSHIYIYYPILYSRMLTMYYTNSFPLLVLASVPETTTPIMTICRMDLPRWTPCRWQMFKKKKIRIFFSLVFLFTQYLNHYMSHPGKRFFIIKVPGIISSWRLELDLLELKCRWRSPSAEIVRQFLWLLF